jgi:hypothetical protein
MAQGQPKKCAHTNCTCVCTDGKKYCSAHCEDSAHSMSLACHCPHTECTGHV